jgi:hypothetical protein
MRHANKKGDQYSAGVVTRLRRFVIAAICAPLAESWGDGLASRNDLVQSRGDGVE